ncbi:XdhC family protein [Marinobacter salexigens]|uniref:XdhC family protein n=1 Tax=Marinobacter salexigens TaxID=1925763 RepID=UPI0012901147|nr:XdhC family protein [Marinobacter salexigens]
MFCHGLSKAGGCGSALLWKLRAPIGINIPSKTPAEIAISVVADLIAARHHLRITHEPCASPFGK